MADVVQRLGNSVGYSRPRLDLFFISDHPHVAGDGLRPVRAGSRLALGLWPEGVQRLRRSRVGPGDHFCEAVRNDLWAPLTVEGHSRTLSGPFPDPTPTRLPRSRMTSLEGCDIKP